MKIVLSAVLALFLVACSDEKPQDVRSAEPAQVSTVEAKPASEVKKDVEVAVSEVAKEVETVVAVVQEKGAEVVTKAVEEAKVATVAAVAEVGKVVEVAKSAIEPEVKAAEVKTEVKETASVNADVLYKTCAGCHGANGEKPALGKSQVIKGWSSDKVETALNGYKDGTYGGAMKGIMTGQVSKLSGDEIKALSEHISKL